MRWVLIVGALVWFLAGCNTGRVDTTSSRGPVRMSEEQRTQWALRTPLAGSTDLSRCRDACQMEFRERIERCMHQFSDDKKRADACLEYSEVSLGACVRYCSEAFE